MPVPPDFPFTHDRDTAIFTELYQIVKTLIAAEEAFIRQITPLINIPILSQVKIGSKGNIHCICQKSKLNLILPNLPKDCRWIVIKLRQGYGTMATMKSTTFTKLRIERVLCLLVQACEPWASIQISQENLSAWPVDGDFTDLNEDFHVILEDYIIEDTTNPTTNDHTVLDTNGEDACPAELKNSVEEI